ncbi:MAG TPA: VWA domain-containing protein [Blastocatellia bacterium]|nr:VWA domain-containing protein [Blastocatellia bacterium]
MKRLCLIVLLLLTLAPVLQAQEKKQDKDEIIKIDTDLVMVEVTATDKRGNYVRNLKAEDFRLFVDGQPRPIDFFTVTDEITQSRPLAVVFALDLSGSLKPEEIETLRASALKFTEIMKGESVFATLAFNYEVKVLQDFTPEQKKIERAFAKIENFGGSTRLYDALDKAVIMLSKRAHFSKSNRPLRRAVVVITDGFDSSSLIDTRELIRRANAAGVTVYSITLPSYILSASRNNERVITPLDASRIVAATGGRDFAADVRDFAPIFKALAEEIRASYGLAYYPEMRDGKQHDVRVEPVNSALQLRSNRTTFLAPAK